MRRGFAWTIFALSLLAAPRAALATTYRVGPGMADTTLASVSQKVQAGDVVEVEGGNTFAGDAQITTSGTPGRPIIFRGMARGGKLPVIQGGDYGITLHGNHLVFENFEVRDAKMAGIVMKGNEVVVRHVSVHDCQKHGILGTDEETGNLLIEFSEIFKNGGGDRHHQVYVATDEEKFKGSTFRLQFNWIHDARGGVSVKSRAERTEIYANWIEGAMYQELDLIGAEEHDENRAREDADVVGNVFRRTSGGAIARLGGDGSGQSKGRYRFLNNTMILHKDGGFVFRAQDGIESIELENNVFWRESGPAYGVVREEDADWVGKTSNVFGANNWMNVGVKIPPGMQGTVTGTNPGFVDPSQYDYTPRCDGPLANAGTDTPTSPPKFPFPKPFAVPTISPARAFLPVGPGPKRPKNGVVDIGAFECAGAAQGGPAPAKKKIFGFDSEALGGLGPTKLAAGGLIGGGLLFALVRLGKKRAPTSG